MLSILARIIPLIPLPLGLGFVLLNPRFRRRPTAELASCIHWALPTRSTGELRRDRRGMHFPFIHGAPVFRNRGASPVYKLCRLCHGNANEPALRAKLAKRHAAATAPCHCAVASALKIRSVDREMRWRCRLKVLWMAAGILRRRL